jgi:hypothetical protein
MCVCVRARVGGGGGLLFFLPKHSGQSIWNYIVKIFTTYISESVFFPVLLWNSLEIYFCVVMIVYFMIVSVVTLYSIIWYYDWWIGKGLGRKWLWPNWDTPCLEGLKKTMRTLPLCGKYENIVSVCCSRMIEWCIIAVQYSYPADKESNFLSTSMLSN